LGFFGKNAHFFLFFKDELRQIQLSRDALAASLTLVNGEKLELEEWVEQNRDMKTEFDVNILF